MKVHRLSPRLLLPLVLALHFVPTVGRGQEDVLRDLAEFRKKMETKEATPAGTSGRDSQIPEQLRMLEALIAREEFDKATLMLGTIGNTSLPPELQNELQDLRGRLAKSFETRRAQVADRWRLEVDQLLKDARKECLEAKSSADLDPLMIRCSALQMHPDKRGNILVERAGRKLSAVIATVNAWATYLDSRDAGNVRQANDALKIASSAEYPVLAAAEISSRILVDARDTTRWRLFVAGLVKDAATPDDLPKILQALKKEIPQDVGTDLGMAFQDQTKIEALIAAWTEAKQGNLAGMARSLSTYKSNYGSDTAQRYFDALVPMIVHRQLQTATAPWSKLTPNPGEDGAGFLTRVLEELKTAGNFTAMIEVIKIADQLYRSQQSTLAVTAERIAIENFLSAQRFEQAGDALAAVVYYRLVISATSTVFAPKEEAQAALKKVGAAHPEALKSYDGAMAEDLRVLRQQMQMLLSRPPTGGRPF